MSNKIRNGSFTMLAGVERKEVNTRAFRPAFYANSVPIASWVPYFDDGECDVFAESNKGTLITF